MDRSSSIHNEIGRRVTKGKLKVPGLSCRGRTVSSHRQSWSMSSPLPASSISSTASGTWCSLITTEITLSPRQILSSTPEVARPLSSPGSQTLAPRASFNKFSTIGKSEMSDFGINPDFLTNILIEVIQILLVTVVYVPLSHNPDDHDDGVSTIVKTEYQQL